MTRDNDALSHLKKRIEAVISERDHTVLSDISGIKRRAAAAGRLQSGGTIHAISDLIVAECRIRSEMFAQALFDVWGAFEPSSAAMPVAEQMVKDELSRSAAAQQKALMDSAPTLGLSGIPGSAWDSLKSSCSQAEDRLRLKLTEWKARQLRPAPPSGSTQTTNVMFSGNNNTVMAGLFNSSASIQIDRITQEKLQAVLAEVRTAISETRSLPADDERETLELVTDCERELQSSKPNKRRLSASLQGIATAIQTVGSLTGAYAALKSAMALIGVTLP